MGLFSFFSKAPATDYETVLARLSTEINEAKTHLSEIRLRERRVSLLLYAYGVLAWAIWVGLWWINGLPWNLFGVDEHTLGRALGAAGTFTGPLGIFFLGRILRWFYSRQRVAEEMHLRKLLTQQRKQIDEIKKATNYNSTKTLIERYDQSNGSPSPQRGSPMSINSPSINSPDSPSPAPRGAKPLPLSVGPQGTPRAPGHLVGGTPAPVTPQGKTLTPEQAQLFALQQAHLQSGQVLPTPEKRWYDRVADSILGDDPSQGAREKYALVCSNCFRHNGLVPSKEEWERLQWICPRCNFMNPAPRGKTSPTLPGAPKAAAPQVNPAASPRVRRQPNNDISTPRSSRLRESSTAEDVAREEEEEEEHMDVDELS